MALSEREKKILANIVIETINTIFENSDSISIADFRQRVLDNENCPEMARPTTSINASLDRVANKITTENRYIIRDGGYLKAINNMIVIDISNDNNDIIHKDKNILSFNAMPNLTYDFITKKFSEDITNKKLVVKYYSSCQIEEFSNRYGYLLDMLQYEWLFNYVDSLHELWKISDICSKDDYEKMPTGIISAIQDNNNCLTACLLNEYVDKMKYGKYYKFVHEVIYNCSDKDAIDYYISCYKNLNGVLKMITNSILNGDFVGDNFTRKFFRDYYNACKTVNEQIPLDFNRDMETNLINIQNVLDKEKNEKLSKQMQRLNFINGITKEDMIIVVPQTQEEKQAEGRMQNNCVGHYYDDNILKGRDLIYFIRKASNPSKSYITCRYNVGMGNTVEYRIKNNDDVRSKKALEFIEEISATIKANLS